MRRPSQFLHQAFSWHCGPEMVLREQRTWEKGQRHSSLLSSIGIIGAVWGGADAARQVRWRLKWENGWMWEEVTKGSAWRLRGQDAGAVEEGIMRLQDQRVQLKTSLAGRCERKFKEVNVLLLEKVVMHCRGGLLQGCSSQGGHSEVASETDTKLVSLIAELFEQINYINVACSSFNKWKIKEV